MSKLINSTAKSAKAAKSTAAKSAAAAPTTTKTAAAAAEAAAAEEAEAAEAAAEFEAALKEYAGMDDDALVACIRGRVLSADAGLTELEYRSLKDWIYSKSLKRANSALQAMHGLPECGKFAREFILRATTLGFATEGEGAVKLVPASEEILYNAGMTFEFNDGKSVESVDFKTVKAVFEKMRKPFFGTVKSAAKKSTFTEKAQKGLESLENLATRELKKGNLSTRDKKVLALIKNALAVYYGD